jgi:hypothetical protein
MLAIPVRRSYRTTAVRGRYHLRLIPQHYAWLVCAQIERLCLETSEFTAREHSTREFVYVLSYDGLAGQRCAWLVACPLTFLQAATQQAGVKPQVKEKMSRST